MMRRLWSVIAFCLVLLLTATPPIAADPNAPVTDRQLAVMMFVDYGRAYGFQTMMARIQVDTVKAELERDRALLAQKQKLFRKKIIPLLELEVAQLRVDWGRKQLVVAEKNLIYISAEYEAMSQMAKHFAGVKIPAKTLYATFRRGWDAGCEKGPDEVEAMKARVTYLTKSLERSRQLRAQGNAPLHSVLEKEARLKIAQSHYQNRHAALDRCRKVLFPSLEAILAIKE